MGRIQNYCIQGDIDITPIEKKITKSVKVILDT